MFRFFCCWWLKVNTETSTVYVCMCCKGEVCKAKERHEANKRWKKEYVKKYKQNPCQKVFFFLSLLLPALRRIDSYETVQRWRHGCWNSTVSIDLHLRLYSTEREPRDENVKKTQKTFNVVNSKIYYLSCNGGNSSSSSNSSGNTMSKGK